MINHKSADGSQAKPVSLLNFGSHDNPSRCFDIKASTVDTIFSSMLESIIGIKEFQYNGRILLDVDLQLSDC